MNCSICDAHKNETEILFQNDDWILRKAEQNLDGYLYLELRRHVESWFGLGISVFENYGRAIHQATEILKEYNPEKMYIVAIAERVPHLHVHLIPRYENQDKGLDHIAKATGPGFPKPM
ncbi:HIT family protein [Leptospira perdikensis]|uniref:HIT family hydrolase n=1 Tax=Leptospira perdikensis TaxID=2484948 RepID=A0A4R9JDP7_9LEPT|nr:HIT domain-containing protein [Leptospira perdikensis]TGL37579.1 HIT family hydrolase [Leptospira perdikensis]